MHALELVTSMTPLCVPASERSVVSTDSVQSQALSLVSVDLALSPLPPEGDFNDAMSPQSLLYCA